MSVLYMFTVEAPRSRELPRDAVSFKICLPQARTCAAQPLGSYCDPALYFPKLKGSETRHHVRVLKGGHITVKSDLSPS